MLLRASRRCLERQCLIPRNGIAGSDAAGTRLKAFLYGTVSLASIWLRVAGDSPRWARNHYAA